MKRFYKFLMPLVAIVAMALPWDAQAQSACPIKIVGEDAYGDGWNDGYLTIQQGGVTIATFDASNADDGGMEVGAYDSISVVVSDATPITFVWTSGMYDSEVTIWIYNGSDSLVFTVSNPNAGTIYTMPAAIINCPSCGMPVGLTATVTNSDVDLNWTAGDGTAWDLVWGTGSFNPDTVTVNAASVTTNSYSFTGLDDGMYTAYVRTDCGSGEHSIWASVNFNIGILIMNMATSGTQTISTCNATIYDNGGATGSYADNCQSTLIITPATVGDWVSISGSSYTESTYDYLTIYEGNTTSGEVLWTDNGIDALTNFGPFSADAITVVFHSDGSVQRDGFTINVTCVPGPSCLRPASFAATNLAPDTAYLAWSDPIGSSWLLAYGPAGFTLGDATTTYETLNDTVAEVGGLTPNTSYDFYIMTLCGADTSMSRKITVRTPCLLIDSLPYTNSFEDATTGSSTTFTFGDPCWTLNTDATTYPYVYVSSSSTYAHTGGKGIYWYRSSSTGSYGSYQCLVLPGVDASLFPINTLQLKFWAKASSASYQPVFQVGVMTNPNDINTFELVGTVNVEGTNWTEYEALLGAYTGTGRFVAVRSLQSSDYWYAYVDDFTLEPLPACPHPVDLVADSISTDEIFVHWTALGSESSWLVTINDSVVADATDTTYVFSNLDANTQYTITVAALCADGDTSASISLMVRTLAGLPISTFPYFCGFEIDSVSGVNEATDWVLENANNGWYVGTVANNGGEKGLYISDNNGAANSYSGSACVSYAYASFQLEAGEYAYSFDWRCNGESSFDYLRVAYAPYGTTLPTSYSSWGTGATAPSGFTALDGGKLNQQNSWQNHSGTFTVTTAGVYNLYFVWRNDGSVYNSPAAAIDNIQIVRNTCPAPANMIATYVGTDTVTVAWHAGGTETEWEISGNGITDGVYDSSYTFTGLNPNTAYTFRVRGICGDDDTSMWSSVTVRTACGLLSQLPFTEDFETTGTTTSSNNNFIPCWHKVNNATSYYYPYVSNSTTYNHTEGGSMGIYWYGSPSTASYGTYRMIVMPGVDTTEIPMNTTKLTFWAKSSSTSYYPVFYVGVMSDPTADSTFVYYDTINLPNNTNWAKYTVLFDNFEGEGNYVAIRDNTGGSYWYAYVDDITLDVIPDCPSVEDVHVQAGPASAIVDWNVIGSNYTGALVEYKADSVETWSSVTVSGDHYAIINGLDPETLYDLRVSAVCGDANANAVNTTFATTAFGCAQFDTTNLINVTIGAGSTTSSYIPSYSFYNYGYSQQFFTASEIGSSGVITKVTLYPTAISQQRTYMIYMAQTADSAASSFVNPTGLTCVYNGGPVTLVANQPVTFELTTPFNYSDSSNLLVVFNDLTGSYVSGNAWAGDNASWSNASGYDYQDGSAYTPGSVSDGTFGSFRNKITFFGGTCLQQSTCAAPLPLITNVTPTSVNVVWAPGAGENAWNVYYRLAGDDTWSAPVAVTTNEYNFTGLNSGTNYEFMVENVCGTEVLSNTVSTATLCATISNLPFTENFNTWGTGSGVLPNCWYRTGSYSSYTYISGSYNHSGATGGSIYMYQSAANHSAIFLPAIDTNVLQVNQTQLVFHVLNTSASYLHAGFEVGVLSDPSDITTFVPVDTVYHSAGPSIWEIFEVPLNNYTGNGTYIGLRTTDNPNSGTEYTYTYPYLDDFTLEAIPTCPRPDSLNATNATTNSVDLSWHDRGGASQWIVEYGPRGFHLGTGTQVVATSNPFTLAGLPSSYQGEYYVKAICGAGDTSEFSRMSFAFGTTQVPATLPYDYDFESATEWANWQTSSNNATKNWYRGTSVADSGSYSMYVATSDSASYYGYSFDGVVNAAAYRDIDFGPVDSSYTLSFRARVGGTTTASYDGLMVFLVDPAIATVASPNNITSPWGNVNDLYRIATVRLDTVWNTYEASFDTISGVHRVAFFWFNQNTGASYDNISQPAAVDNIHIDYSSCPRPVNLEAVSTSSSTATLTWDGEAGADYEVTYRQVGGANMTTIAHTNSVTLTGLASTSEYRAWVRKICGAGDTSLYCDGTAFNTTMCDNAVIVATGDPNTATGTTYYAPVNNFYNYTLSETIIDSAEIGGALQLTSLAYYYSYSTASSDKTSVNIWIQPTNKTAFTGTSDMVALDTNIAVMVYSGNLNCSEGWNYFAFTTNYNYSGTGNLLVIVDDNSGAYDGSSYVFASQSTTDYKTITYYSDSDNPNATSPTSFSGNKSYYQYRPVMQLISCGGVVACDDPIITSTTATETTITANWGNTGASSYQVAIVEGTWVEPATGNVAADTTYTFTGLTGETLYTIGVRSVCGATNFSEWATIQVTTEAHPCAVPTNVTATDMTFNGATISWTLGEAETEWDIRVIGTNYDSIVTVQTNPYTLTGLTAAQEYTVTVRARCAEDRYSDWSEPATFSTLTCQPVNGVTVGNVTTTSATVSWTAPAGVSNFEVEYGTSGFARGNGTTVSVNGTSYTITGLSADMAYDVYVRSVCAEGITSAWSEATEFTTLEEQEGIDDIANAAISLYPNPASSTVTISGIEGEATVTVVDMNGRVVITTQSVSESVTLSLTELAQGAYFVRITGEQVNAIRKLIVR